MVGFKGLLSTEEYDFIFECAVPKAIGRIQLSDMKKVIDALCLHYVILVSLAELEELQCGLAIQKCNSLMESVPKAIRKCLNHQSKTYQVVLSRLCMYNALFSPDGSNKRVLEESIMMSWVQYLQYVEGEIRFV